MTTTNHCHNNFIEYHTSYLLYFITICDFNVLLLACLLVSQSSRFNFERLIKVLCSDVKSHEIVKYLVEILGKLFKVCISSCIRL